MNFYFKSQLINLKHIKSKSKSVLWAFHWASILKVTANLLHVVVEAFDVNKVLFAIKGCLSILLLDKT